MLAGVVSCILASSAKIEFETAKKLLQKTSLPSQSRVARILHEIKSEHTKNNP